MTSFILFGGIIQAIYGIILFLTSLFLILLVLIQRGRGGGLSGAFGGMGGQSAFGAKAGDTFTKVTIGAAAFWIVLCLIGVKYMGEETGVSKFVDADVPSATGIDGPLGLGEDLPAGGASDAETPQAEVSTEEDVSENASLSGGPADEGS